MNSEPTTDQSHVKQWIDKISDVRSLLTNIALVVFIPIAIIILIFIAFSDITDEKVVIDLIEVPEAPKAAKDELPVGYTKITLTRQLLDKAQQINEELQIPIFDSLDESYSLAKLSSFSTDLSTECQNKKNTSKDKGSTDCNRAKTLGSKPKLNIPPPHPLLPNWDEPDIELPGIKLSLKSLKRFLRQALGVPETHITGEITVTKKSIADGITNEFHLNLRSDSSKDFRPDPITEHYIDNLLVSGGANLLALIDPCTSASYIYTSQMEREEGRFNKLIDACLNDSPELAFYGYLLLAQKAAQENDFVEAIKKYRKAIQINSESSEAPDWWLALFEPDKLIGINGRSAYAYYYWGLVILEQDQANQAEAIDKFNKAIKSLKNLEQNIDKIDAKQQADIYLLWGNLLLNLASINKNDPAIRNEAFKKFEKVSGLDKQKEAIAFVLWGNALLDSKDIEGAIEKYQKAAELQPNYAIAYNNWGIVLYGQGKVSEAIAKYKEAIDKNSGYADPYYNWGVAQMQKGKIENANLLFKEVVKNDKNKKFKSVYYPYAITLENLGKPEEAIVYYEKAQELYPESSVFYNDWGNAFLDAAKNDKQKLDKAIEQYKKAICIDQNYFYSYYNYGLALEKQERYADAITLYQKALDTDKEKLLLKNSFISIPDVIAGVQTKMKKSHRPQVATANEILLKCTATENPPEQPKSEVDFAESDSDSQVPIVPKVIIWLLTVGIAVLLTGLLVIFFKKRIDQAREPSIPEPQSPITPPVHKEPPPTSRRLTQVEEYIPMPEHQQPATLLCVTGTMQSRKFPIEKEIFTIGANSQNDLCIPDDEYVSGHHACLKYEKGSLIIFDSGSRNGTFVNGQRITGAARQLKPGDRIQIGKESFEVLLG